MVVKIESRDGQDVAVVSKEEKAMVFCFVRYSQLSLKSRVASSRDVFYLANVQSRRVLYPHLRGDVNGVGRDLV